MVDTNEYNQAWDDLDKTLTAKKITAFFDDLYASIKRFYEDIGSPPGHAEQDMWDWAKQELFEAHKRAIAAKERTFGNMLNSYKQKPPGRP